MPTALDALTPREIVAELDRYIIGQDKAKRAVSLALRSRWRRQRVSDELRDEISPKNIIMIGPTGVGKTEIARRLARLAQAPFLKVEASKFTEVGYVGRDVESMVRDLVETSVAMVRAEHQVRIRSKSERAGEDRLIDALVKAEVSASGVAPDREELRRRFRAGELDERMIEVHVEQNAAAQFQLPQGNGMESMGINLGEMLGNLAPKRKKAQRMRARDAFKALCDEEADKLVDQDAIVSEALDRAQNQGIIFLDEIDKVAGRQGSHGPDVSREGVQRDLLPIVEGSNVKTKHGMVKTDKILFVAAGAFHVSKPSDLIPELQGRFPIRVELESLDASHFKRILTEPKNSLTKQYVALMGTEGVEIVFRDDALDEIANMAHRVNQANENIGARRLHTVMERLFDEVSFHAPDMRGTTVEITRDYVREQLQDIIDNQDLSRYIL